VLDRVAFVLRSAFMGRCAFVLGGAFALRGFALPINPQPRLRVRIVVLGQPRLERRFAGEALDLALVDDGGAMCSGPLKFWLWALPAERTSDPSCHFQNGCNIPDRTPI
jgi:hypothetical protein